RQRDGSRFAAIAIRFVPTTGPVAAKSVTLEPVAAVAQRHHQTADLWSFVRSPGRVFMVTPRDHRRFLAATAGLVERKGASTRAHPSAATRGSGASASPV